MGRNGIAGKPRDCFGRWSVSLVESQTIHVIYRACVMNSRGGKRVDRGEHSLSAGIYPCFFRRAGSEYIYILTVSLAVVALMLRGF